MKTGKCLEGSGQCLFKSVLRYYTVYLPNSRKVQAIQFFSEIYTYLNILVPIFKVTDFKLTSVF
jgi:hypothetical protein